MARKCENGDGEACWGLASHAHSFGELAYYEKKGCEVGQPDACAALKKHQDYDIRSSTEARPDREADRRAEQKSGRLARYLKCEWTCKEQKGDYCTEEETVRDCGPKPPLAVHIECEMRCWKQKGIACSEEEIRNTCGAKPDD